MKKIINKILGFFVLLLLTASFLTVFSNEVYALPANFTNSKLAENLNMPTDFALLPDGRILITEKGGAIKVFKNGSILNQDAAVINVNNEDERGLLGITPDPNFSANNFIYVYYVNSNPVEIRVSRFTMNGDLANLNSEQILLKSVLPIGQIHHSGTVRIGPDGKLWISIGNNADTSNSQNLSNIHGKILRINKDGTIPSDNPFGNSIWAYGLRNPFRFNFLPNGQPAVGDVGDNSWEEVNFIVKGGNYGYPHAEGVCNGCPYINPAYSYPHNFGSASVTGGFVYKGNQFPSEYKNSYFFGDYGLMFIKRLILDVSNNVIGEQDFDAAAGRVVELLEGADGSLYYLTIFPGELHKISYNQSNLPPVVKASADKTSGDSPLAVSFSSQGTADPENNNLSYSWDFGDGQNSNSANPSHTFQKGKFIVKLTVSDGTNSVVSDSIEILSGLKAPSASILTPFNNSKFNAGDTISFSGVGSDPEDGILPDSAFRWSFLFHHKTHVHPSFTDITGTKSGSITIPNTGEADPDIWYEIILTVTDSSGIKNTTSINVIPNKINLTITSQPEDLNLNLDGIPLTTPFSTQAVVGFKRTLDAPTPQNKGGENFQFKSWSDGGLRVHQITVPSGDTTYTAAYNSAGTGTGNLRFRIREFNGTDWTGKFINGAVVKLTDTAGNTIISTKTSSIINNEDGWVHFDNIPSGTYGILSYRNGFEGVWKQIDCASQNGSTINATIENGNTAGLMAAWDDNAQINPNQITYCQDLGLKPITKAKLGLRVFKATKAEFGYVNSGFINDATVKLTDTSGSTVLKTALSKQVNNEDGWVWLDDIEAGTYGLMAYKSGYDGIIKQVDCGGAWAPNSSINNQNTESQTAAWNNSVNIEGGKVNFCYDLGLQQKEVNQKGSVAFRIREFKNGVWTGGFINGVTVKLTNQTGDTVFQTKTSAKNSSNEDGWVIFEGLDIGNYGALGYKNDLEGFWKQTDCAGAGTATDATKTNGNTEGLKAAYDNSITINSGQITYCQDLGLKPKIETGTLALRIREFNGTNWTGKFINDAQVKLTDQSGNNPVTSQLSKKINDQDGWVIFENVSPGGYGVLSYKSGFEGVWKQVNCDTPSGTLVDATIQNSNTENMKAAWDTFLEVKSNEVTWCQDLGLKPL